MTVGIGAGEEKAWKLALARLRQARLVAEASDNGDSLDAHPLVREHFGERLREMAPGAWRVGNERLYEHYQQAAPEYPETLEEMLPLYAAVVHGCRAGREQDASEVYGWRVLRGEKHFSWKRLGAFGAELVALAAFFDRPWVFPSDRLSPRGRAWILNETSFVLRALGRLLEAVQPLRAGIDLALQQQDWSNAAVGSGNLSELTLTLGDVANAVSAGEKSVDLADLSGEGFHQVSRRATLADVLHQAGRWEESAAAFREAETIQAQKQPRYPRLYSLAGYQYCDLLLSRAEPDDGSGLDGPSPGYRDACQQVGERADGSLAWGGQGAQDILSAGLDRLSRGRAHLGQALTAPGTAPDVRFAAEDLDLAVDGLRQAGVEEFIARGLLARAALRRLASDLKRAAADLREAEEIAERGSMRLHEADAYLEWTRLHVQTGDLATARTYLARARELVRACGYGRREREVTWLERRLADASASQ